MLLFIIDNLNSMFGFARAEKGVPVDYQRFDDLAQWIASGGTRRSVLGLLAGAGLTTALLPDAEAKKKNNNNNNNNNKNKKKKKRFCLNGENVKAKNKKKKRRLRREGAVKGRCQGCTPECPTNGTCGGDDGCGGICGCAGENVCVSGACEPCTVTCTGDAATCGAALDAALLVGGDIYVCPGLYAASTAPFTILPATTIYGAGSGDDQASNTILDAEGGNRPVIFAPTPSVLSLAGLRITGGNNAAGAGGISSNSFDLTIDNCAVVDNAGSSVGGVQSVGSFTMSNSLVSGNTSTGNVGGMIVTGLLVGDTMTITSSVIEGNTGSIIGGISVATPVIGHTFTIDSTSQVTDNVASGVSQAGGISHTGVGTATANGTTVSGNTNPQCFGVTGC